MANGNSDGCGDGCGGGSSMHNGGGDLRCGDGGYEMRNCLGNGDRYLRR